MTTTDDDLSPGTRGEPLLRDHLAVERTILANERTYLAYIRTALGLIIVALAMLSVAAQSMLAVMAAGVTFVLGLLVGVHGIRKYYVRRTSYRRVRELESRFLPPRR